MSRIGKAPGPQDQRKIYMDWANHYLRKAGYSDVLGDLKDIADGNFLPKIIHAVVQGTVPGSQTPASTEEQKKSSTENCIKFLESSGINCASFSAKDLQDGNMRAILSLFYNLSQYKRTAKPSTPASETPSRIVRPVSPAFKSTFGVNATRSESDLPPSRITRPISPGLKSTHGVTHVPTVGSHSSSNFGSGSGIPSSGIPSSGIPSTKPSPAAQRRTAGSSIMTSTNPYGQRRVPYRPLIIPGGGEKPVLAGGEKAKENASQKQGQSEGGEATAPSSSSSSGGVSPSATRELGTKDQKSSKSVDAAAAAVTASGIPTTSTSSLPNASSSSIPGRSKSQPSKLVAPSSSTTTTSSKGETPSELPTSELQHSRLKYPSSGRATPTPSQSGRSTPSGIPSRSGLARPPSRLTKAATIAETPVSQLRNANTSTTAAEDEARERSSNLRLQRKNSDSAARKHRIESGTSSLPRNLPKGIIAAGGGMVTGTNDSELISPTKQNGSLHDTNNVEEGSKLQPATTLQDSSDKGKTGGGETPKRILKRPGNFGFGATGVRTPNLPSGPTSATSSGERGELSSPSVEKSADLSPQLQKPPAGKKLLPSERNGGPQLQKRTQRSIPKTREYSSSSNSSLDSCTCSEVSVKPAQSSVLDGSSIAVSPPPKVDPVAASKQNATTPLHLSVVKRKEKSDIISPPAAFSERTITKEASDSGSTTSVESGAHSDSRLPSKPHPRYGRRISPEGMSHEEIATSPKDKTSDVSEKNLRNEKELEPTRVSEQGSKGMIISETLDSERSETKKKEVESSNVKSAEEAQGSKADGQKETADATSGESGSPASRSKVISQPETGQLYSDSMSPQLKRTGERVETIKSDRFTHSEEVHHAHFGRIKELSKSPQQEKRARSLSPKSSRRVGTYSLVDHSYPRSPLSPERLCLGRTSSNASTKSETTNAGPAQKPLRSSLRSANKGRTNNSSSSLETNSPKSIPKVTISPRSSQVVYLPGEVGLQPPPYANKPFLSPAVSADRPQSLVDSTSSESPPGSTHVLPYSRMDVVRRSSMRSTMSEKLDYSDELRFLNPNLEDVANERYGSTPELLESFENQLSTMRRDLDNKERMLNMYENSMADLSSKVHRLKKTLEEKDIEIKQLTEVKHTHWYDLEGRSLMSRASSENGVLSDGALSDSAMGNSKGSKKKKKPWKRFSFRKKPTKDMDHLHPNMDTASVISVISARSAKGLRRHPSKGKPSDLVSISEYTTERFRDLDTKSMLTLDTRSEYGALPLPFPEDSVITVYEDSSPGAKASVTLFAGINGTGYGISSSMGSMGSLASMGGDEWEQVVLGTLSVAPEISWVTMDSKICEVFMHHVSAIDPDGTLGLSEDSILKYQVGDQRREIGNALLPPLTPYQAIASPGGRSSIRIVMRGASHGSCDSLAYKTLVNTDTLQSYMSMLMETRWLVVMGTKGTCKTSLATGLANHLALCVSDDIDSEGHVISFNMDKDEIERVLQYMKNDLAKKVHHLPHSPILLIDNVYLCEDLEQILVAAGSLSRRPYVISTLCSGTARGTTLHQLLFHHQIRLIACNPQNEPIVGILSRSLRKQVYSLKTSSESVDAVAERMLNWLPFLLDHLNTFIYRFHSNNVAIGPRVFMSCPLDQTSSEVEAWFINLWNHFLIPYLMGTIMAGIETYTADPSLDWMDVREWVVETYPWQPTPNVMKLRTLCPEDVGWNHAVRPQANRLMLIKDDS